MKTKIKKLAMVLVIVGIVFYIKIEGFSNYNSNKDLENEIIEYFITVNKAMDLGVTNRDVREFMNSLRSEVKIRSIKEGVSEKELYKRYLNELKKEIDLKEIKESEYKSGGDDIGYCKLPKAKKGNIFFTDNNKPYNHVGIYYDDTTIVESMPKDGVKKWSIYNIESYQKPVKDSSMNESCILRVLTSNSNMHMAAFWASCVSKLNKPYDYDFLDNKSDYYRVRVGDHNNPQYVYYPESDAFNCSELVWKSYKKSSGIDLDSNGGLGVYPNDIKNSNMTVIIDYFGD